MSSVFTSKHLPRLLLSALLLWSLSTAGLGEPACAPDSDKAAPALVAAWQKAVTSGDAARLAGFYAPDAIIIDAMMGQSEHRGAPAVADFYKSFVKQHPSADTKITALKSGCNEVQASGPIALRIAGPRKGTRRLLEGRLSVTLAHREGRWQVTRHELTLVRRPNRQVGLYHDAGVR